MLLQTLLMSLKQDPRVRITPEGKMPVITASRNATTAMCLWSYKSAIVLPFLGNGDGQNVSSMKFSPADPELLSKIKREIEDYLQLD